MTTEYAITGIWCVRIILNLLAYGAVWYIKEYRLDRMAIHLRDAPIRKVFFPKFRRPPLSPRAVGGFLVSSGILIALFSLLRYPPIVRIMLLDLVSFPVSALTVFIFTVPVKLYHAWIIRRALRLFRKHGPMTVIAITGSYGKTSTKEILASILGTKYPTLKTEASKNSPIAIAELFLKDLRPDHEVCIIEMGAYKTGEIKEMCEMVRPEIAILTAVNEQHQDLFGSIEETMKAKYELIQGLTGRKIAVINMDNEKTREMSRWAVKDGVTVVPYTVSDTKNIRGARITIVGDIQAATDSITITVSDGIKNREVTIALAGGHQASNVLAALNAAVLAGMTFDEAVDACASIRPFTRTMQIVPGLRGAVFVDDTFNNNPDAAVAAIQYLSRRKHSRIFVFQPMIELGQYASESHRRVGAMAGRICDVIILTNDSNFRDFEKGLSETAPGKHAHVLAGKSGAEYLKQHIHAGDTVLFKGKEASVILHDVMKTTQPIV